MLDCRYVDKDFSPYAYYRELSPEERERQRTEQERQAKEQERLAKEQAQQRVEQLEEMLRSQGMNPDRLPDAADSGD